MVIKQKHMGPKPSLLYGFGVNDAEHQTRIGEYYWCEKENKRKYKTVWTCPAFNRWSNMIARCYREPRSKRNRRYEDCSISEEWRYFSAFYKWVKEFEDWENKQVDKDLLVQNNRVYGPSYCLMVRECVNRFTMIKPDHDRVFAIGVSWSCGKFRANINGKTVGTFDTELEAHRVWQKYKIGKCEDIIVSETDERVLQGLHRVHSQLLSDVNNHRLTNQL